MRVIEKNMNLAIAQYRNWSSGNTRVTFENGKCKVYLHGNLIAKRIENKWSFTMAGWNTNVTRSRINALCRGFFPRYCVMQKNFDPYLYDFHDDKYTPISSYMWVVV